VLSPRPPPRLRSDCGASAATSRESGRWALLDEVDEGLIDRVVELLASLRVLAAERAALGGDWTGLCARSATLPDRRRVAATIEQAQRSADQRLERIRRQCERSLRDAGFAVEVGVSAEAQSPGAVWPPGRLVAVVDLSRSDEWPRLVDSLLGARAEQVDEYRAMSALVSLNGRLSACLSGEVANAWWPRTDTTGALPQTPAPEPRGTAWRRGVSAAARVRTARRWMALAEGDGPLRAHAAASAEAVEIDLLAAR